MDRRAFLLTPALAAAQSAPPAAEPPAALVPPAAEPPATVAPPAAEPPAAVAPPVAEPPAALAPPVAEPPDALVPPAADPALAPIPPDCVEPPVEGDVLLPPAPLPALPTTLLPALPAAPLPAPPPVVEWIVPPDGAWPLLFEPQPRLTAAAYHSPKAAMMPKRSFAISIRPVCIAFILHEKQGSRHYRRIEARSVSCLASRHSQSRHPSGAPPERGATIEVRATIPLAHVSHGDTISKGDSS